MPIEFTQLHAATNEEALNTEWFILTNNSKKPFNTRNCTLEVSRVGRKKARILGTIDPGFALSPGDSVRVITGNPGRKAHGEVPTDDTKNYHLFLGSTFLKHDATIVTLRLRTLRVATATYDATADNGVRPKPTPKS